LGFQSTDWLELFSPVLPAGRYNATILFIGMCTMLPATSLWAAGPSWTHLTAAVRHRRSVERERGGRRGNGGARGVLILRNERFARLRWWGGLHYGVFVVIKWLKLCF